MDPNILYKFPYIARNTVYLRIYHGFVPCNTMLYWYKTIILIVLFTTLLYYFKDNISEIDIIEFKFLNYKR